MNEFWYRVALGGAWLFIAATMALSFVGFLI
jgi:hypothetical protein